MAALSFQTVLGPEQTRALEATRFGDVRFLDVVDSTNRMLLDLARAGADEGLVLVADEQTAGRGRMGRTWQAPRGSSLLVSVLLRPDLPAERSFLATAAAGVAAVDACNRVAGARVTLKWPNDVFAATPDGPRKLGGILAEAVLDGSRAHAIVVGMGLNVAWGELPADLEDTATALDVLGSSCSRADVLVAWLEELDGRYQLVVEGRADELLQDYRRRCGTIGQRVRVELGGGVVQGTATGVSDDGHLLLDTADGLREIVVGDVVHLRPAES